MSLCYTLPDFTPVVEYPGPQNKGDEAQRESPHLFRDEKTSSKVYDQHHIMIKIFTTVYINTHLVKRAWGSTDIS